MAMVRATGTSGAWVTGADDPPVPAGLMASMRTGYWVPLVRPVITSGLAIDAGLRTVQVWPLSVE